MSRKFVITYTTILFIEDGATMIADNDLRHRFDDAMTSLRSRYYNDPFTSTTIASTEVTVAEKKMVWED